MKEPEWVKRLDINEGERLVVYLPKEHWSDDEMERAHEAFKQFFPDNDVLVTDQPLEMAIVNFEKPSSDTASSKEG